MTDRPIIFSAAMVRALLDGRKTQTRRLATSPLRKCEPGDRLWVRESWSAIFWDPSDIDGPAREYHATPKAERTKDLCSGTFYQMDEVAKPFTERFVPERQWTPSIHMPRWASRLTLIVEAVRVEPLQAISPEDARDEGVERRSRKVRQIDLFGASQEERERLYLQACVWEYEDLWNSLHGAGSWDENPNIVALTFRVVRGNIDRSEG